MTIGRSTGAIGCLAVAFLFSGAALAECPSFPKVAWWGTLSHDKAIRYVEKKHEGDWSNYKNKWQRQLAKVESIRDRGGSIVFKKRGIRLKGDALGDYVVKLKKRVSVIDCLAEEDEIRTAEAEKLEKFSTAAGSNGKAPQK